VVGYNQEQVGAAATRDDNVTWSSVEETGSIDGFLNRATTTGKLGILVKADPEGWKQTTMLRNSEAETLNL
jgi:hypothetical protein